MKVWIFDLDGTLTIEDGDAIKPFSAAAALNALASPLIEVAKAVEKPDKLIILTARTTDLKKVTVKWLRAQIGHSNFSLIMREPNVPLRAIPFFKVREIAEIKNKLKPEALVFYEDSEANLHQARQHYTGDETVELIQVELGKIKRQ